MASTTGAHRGASVPAITLHWAPVAWLQRTMATTRSIIGSSMAAAHDYEAARSDSARRAVLERFAADGR